MVQIEYLPIVLTGLGITASILYYTITLRNSNKTRQTQLYMQLLDRVAEEENRLRAVEVLQQDYTDYNDFMAKWGMYSNPVAYSKRIHVLSELDGIGHLLYKGLIDLELLHPIILAYTELQWEKWSPIIYEQRKTQPDRQKYFEYLYNEIQKTKNNR